MSNISAPILPVPSSERISIIDSLRGFALLGILMMNIPFFSTPYEFHYNIDLFKEYSGPNYWCWGVVNGFLEGSMRAMFSMLFGAGSILLLTRLEKMQSGINPADIYYRRIIWLFLFGMFNAFILQWPGDILYAYSICGLFLFPFRNVSAKRLVIFSVVLMLISTFFVNLRHYEKAQIRRNGVEAQQIKASGGQLTEKQEHNYSEWQGYLMDQNPDVIIKNGNRNTPTMQSNWITTFLHLVDINVMIQTNYMYKEYFLDVLMLFFLGMALFKWGIITGERSKKFYWLLLLAYIPGTLIGYWVLHQMRVSHFDASLYWENIRLDLYHLRRICVALGHIALLMLLYKYGVFRFLLKALANVGQMAFTNYLMQSIICTTIFYGFGFGYFGKMQRYETYIVVLCVWIFQIIFSALWLKFFRFGPFEWVWRSLTYWKKQDFKLSKSATPEITSAN